MKPSKLKAELLPLVDSYGRTNKALSSGKKMAEPQNQQIKNLMNQLGIDYFEGEDYAVRLTTIDKYSFDSEALMDYLEEKEILSPIKFERVLDEDELDRLVYSGKINAKDLAKFQINKPISQLRVKERIFEEDEEDF